MTAFRIGAIALALALAGPGQTFAQSDTDLLQQMEEAISERDGTPLPEVEGAEAEPAALIDGTDPAAVLNAVRAFGGAELAADNQGDPMIRAEIGPYRYAVFFYGCTEGKDCSSILFRASFSAEGLSAADMSEWNRTKRFGNGYLDEDGDPVLEMDVNLYGGVSPTNMHDNVDWWRVVIEDFAAAVSR